ncbi:hypothetical protein ACLOJK_010670 [Asimina triloba]
MSGLLQEFVEKNGIGPKTVYTLSGRLKKNPQVYHIRLVSGLQLAEVKQEFEDNCSIQVYSVQDDIPKDPATLWNEEFVQAEELFKQSAADNCLRDNSSNGDPGISASPQPDTGGMTVSSKANGVSQLPSALRPHQQPSLKCGPQSTSAVTTDGKSRPNVPEAHAQDRKDKVTTVPADKKKGQNDRNSSGSGGSLANLWGRASTKSKYSTVETTGDVPNPAITADAQICAQEALDSVNSDDEVQAVRCKRESNGESNRKRRVVLDDSDDDDDDDDDHEKVVSLASPDPPKSQPVLGSKCSAESVVPERKELNFGVENGDKLEIKQEKMAGSDSGLHLKGDFVAAKSRTAGISSSDMIQICAKGLDDKSKVSTSVPPSTSPKRRKVLRTRMDERGREVTEVVWEGEDTDRNNTDKNAQARSPDNRPPAPNKAPPNKASANTASNTVAKAGNKKTAKGGGKDSKQGNILSFFRKVS